MVSCFGIVVQGWSDCRSRLGVEFGPEVFFLRVEKKLCAPCWNVQVGRTAK